MNEIKNLYYIDFRTTYKDGRQFCRPALKAIPVVKETSQSYYVPKINMTSEEFKKRFGNEISQKNCNLVNKRTMKAVVSSIGDRYLRFYSVPFVAKEDFFVDQNAHKIGKALAISKNAFLLRQIAHNLELEDLVELEYDFEEKDEICNQR